MTNDQIEFEYFKLFKETKSSYLNSLACGNMDEAAKKAMIMMEFLERTRDVQLIAEHKKGLYIQPQMRKSIG